MTPAELDDTLDAMQAKAADDPSLMPGLITVESRHWVDVLSAIGATCSRLDDGLRYRNIKVYVGSHQTTSVMTRADAADAGGPYRDLTAGA